MTLMSTFANLISQKPLCAFIGESWSKGNRLLCSLNGKDMLMKIKEKEKRKRKRKRKEKGTLMK